MFPPVNAQTFNLTKEFEETYRPTLLFTVTTVSGNVYTLTSATAAYGTGDGNSGIYFNGTFYNSVIKQQRVGTLQSTSGIGIDLLGQIAITMMDVDVNWMLREYSDGFSGASITATFVFFDPETGNCSPDSKVIFNGICDAGTRTNDMFTLTATSIYNLTKSISPPVPIQRQCPWTFPATAAQRHDALYNILSIYYPCGYSPDQTNGLGNMDGGVPYTACNYTKANCQTNGMYDKDNSGRGTASFGGVQWTPPATWQGKAYTTGKSSQGVNSINEPKWSQYVPLTYGTTWVDAIPANVVGDPNSTRMECIVGYGWYNISDWLASIAYVVVNGLAVPYESETSDLLFRWYGFGDGTRQGYIQQGAPYNGDGDPYGSMLVIMPVVYAAVASSNTPPNVRINVLARPIDVWSSTTSMQTIPTDLVAWVVLDLLKQTRPDLYAKVNIQSVIDYAKVCGAQVPYTTVSGTRSSHRRFGISLSIEKSGATSQLLEGLKISGRLLLVPSADGTEINFLGKQTLADQQPNPIQGSGDDAYFVPVNSVHADGSAGIGYYAYVFNDTNVIAGSLSMMQDPIAQTPVVFSATIQDEDNYYTLDTVTLADPVAYGRIQQKNTSTVQAIGIPNADQAQRILRSKQAETYMGNARSATDGGNCAGTIRWSFKSTFKGVHLTLGMIVSFGMSYLGIPQQAYRIEGIAPDQDFMTATYTIRWHSDEWYVDSFGQS